MDFTDFQVRKCPATAMYIPNFITSEEEQQILSQIERAPKPKWTQLLNRRLINYGGIPHPKGMVAEEIPEWLQTYVDKINNFGIFESQNANHVLVNEYQPGQGIMPHTDGPLFYPTISTITCGSHTVLEFMKRENTHTMVEEVKHHLGEDKEQLGEDKEPLVENKMHLVEDKVHLEAERQQLEEEKQHQLEKQQLDQQPPYTREIFFKLLLEPRSLLILKDSLYSDYLHSISELKSDILCDRIYNYENCETVYKMGDCLERRTRISLTIRNVPKTSKMKLKFF